MKKLLAILIFLPIAFACKNLNSSKPLIAASLPVWKGVAQYIGGKDFRYFSILKPGQSPHGYEPKPSDVATAKKANLVIVHGLGLDNWALKGIDAKRVMDIGKLLSKKYPQVNEPYYHIWANPIMMEDVYFEVARKLSEFNPRRKQYYEKRADDYAATIDEMIGRAKDCLKDVNPKIVVIYHPVWKWFLESIGIKTIPILKTPEASTTPDALKTAVQKAKASGAKIVIGETFNSKDAPNEVAREIGGKAIFLNPIPNGDYVEAISGWSRAICKAMKGEE